MTDTPAPTPPQTPALQAPRTHFPRALPALALFLLAILPFLPALHGEFTWDDDKLLTNSPQVLSWTGLPAIWNPFRQPIQYFPLTYTTFWIEHKLWGLHTTGYHLVNMLLQAAAAIALWRVLQRLGLRAAWIIALLWAIHPVQVDSVAWISERKNTLSGLFYFLSALYYLRFDTPAQSDTAPLNPPRQFRSYLLSLTFFIAALLSKTLVCTLPAALFILLWWKHPARWHKKLLPLLPFFAAAACLALLTAWQEHHNMTVGGGTDLLFSPLQRLIIAGKNVWFYWRTLACPYPLMEIYPRWNLNTSNAANFLPAAALLLLLAGLAVFSRKSTRAPLAALLYFLITLSPLLGFLNFYTMHYSFAADHYQYLACLGPIALVTESIAIATARSPALARTLASLLLIATLAATAFYATLFQTNIQLWSWNVRHNPEAATAQLNLGVSLINASRPAEGFPHIAAALQLDPDDDGIQRAAGKMALSQNNLPAAIHHFQHAIALRPRDPSSYVLLGDTYARMNNPDAAIALYQKAIQVSPNTPDGYISLAYALKKKHLLDQSANAFQLAIALDPENLTTRFDYANLLLDLHRYKDAIATYQFILQQQPNNPDAWTNLAFAYYSDGQLENARAANQHAQALQPSTIPVTP